MSFSKSVSLAAALAVITPVTGVLADNKSEIRQSYIEAFGERGTSASVVEMLGRIFSSFDRDGNGLSLDDIEKIEKLQLAQLRAYSASRILTHDLNGDLAVGQAEAEEAIMLQAGRHMSQTNTNARQKKRLQQDLVQRVSKLMAGDKDGNQILSGAEIYFALDDDRIDQQFKALGGGFARALLKADPNQDGTLTDVEASLLLAQNLADIDTEIAKAVSEKREEQKLGLKSEACKPFDVDKSTKFVALGTYEGTSVSTVTVAGQDEDTTAATIVIEDGDEPLTLLLSSFSPMVWHLKGKTDRVQKVLLSGRKTEATGEKVAAGIVGIAKEKIIFLATQDCFRYFSDLESADAQIAKAVLAKLASRPLDKMMARYGINIVSIPSGAGAEEEERGLDVVQREAETHGIAFSTLGTDAKLKPLNVNPEVYHPTPLEDGMLRYNPTGLLDVKEQDVVSEAPVARYAVLPQEAGLIQLTYEGKLQPIKGGWKVLAKMRFPASLGGAHGTTFFVPKGVPIPEGDPLHSCVFLEETAMTLEGGDRC